jgi:hypothetical protein
LAWVLSGFALLQPQQRTLASEAAPELAKPPVAEGEEPASPLRRDVQRWLDNYASAQILFLPEHIEALREEISGMSEEELEQWWQWTGELRSRLDSQQWRSTRVWFKQLLANDKRFTEDVAKGLRQEAAQMTPTQLVELTMRLEGKRQDLRRMHEESERLRQERLAANRQQLTRERSDWRFAANRAYNQPFPANFSEPGRQRDPRWGLPGPLLTSREVAGFVVWNAVFGGVW